MRSVLDVNKDISTILEKDSLLDKILDALISSLRAQRGIFFSNDKGKGISPQILKNITLDELKKECFRFSMAFIIESAYSQKSIMKIMEELMDDGKNITISLICLPLVHQNNLLGAIYLDIISEIKTFRIQDLDIAEIFSSQASISINNAYLYDKIKQQNLELLKLINLKDQLIDEVSKKIEKPLKEVRGLLETTILTCNISDNDSNQNMTKMSRLIEKMEATLNKVLTIQELEREVNDLFSEKVNFLELFEFIIQNHKETKERKNINISIDLSNDFNAYHANRTIMRTIFDELISNSIFYNKVDGDVRIKGVKNGDFLFIEIADTGNGIKMEDQEHIFEQFYRTIDSPRLNEKGAGLGLFLAKKFIKYYNGDIKVVSEYGVGSTFTVSMMVD